MNTHTIITAPVGFLIECHHDTVTRLQRYQKLHQKSSWLWTLKQQKIPYYFLTGNPSAPSLTPPEKIPHQDQIDPYFKDQARHSPHILYYLISQLIPKTRLSKDFLQVYLPPSSQYRSLIWWIGYYYLIYHHHNSDQRQPQQWIHIPDHCWVNLEKINKHLSKYPNPAYHYLGNLSTQSRTPTISPYSPVTCYPSQPPYLRPYFGPWFDGDQGLIFSIETLRQYLSPVHAVYLWTDIFPDKAMADVLTHPTLPHQQSQYPNRIPYWFISAPYPRHKKPDPSWIKQCLFITGYYSLTKPNTGVSTTHS